MKLIGNGRPISGVGIGRPRACGSVAAAFLALSCLIGCMFRPINLSMHSVVLDLTYSEDKEQPQVDHEFYLYAVLKPTLVRRYTNCPAAIALVLPEGQNAQGDLWSRFVELGKKLNATLKQDDWVKKLAEDWPAAVDTDDPMVALATGETASRAARYVSETSSEAAASPGQDDAISKAGNSVLKRLRQQACLAAPEVDGPSLALSGGSANGAFIAGVLFEFLFAREQRFRELRAKPEGVSFLDSSRFSAVAGTSVGSMIGQIMDLYATRDFCPDGDATSSRKKDTSCAARDAAGSQFRKDKERLAKLKYEKHFRPPTLDKLIAFLEGEPANDAELARLWALALLFENFTDIAEPETICVQPGTVSRVVGFGGKAHPGLMRFDPLQRSVLDPFLEIVADATVQNRFPRIAVSVEVSQNIAVGLDDAACRDRGDRVADCLAAGTMASTVLPFFAQPVNRVLTGLTDAEDCGIWLDGGLRSGLPIEQALRFTRPSADLDRGSLDHSPNKKRTRRLRTLAISTNRALGLPSNKRADRLIDIAAEAIGEMGDQVNTSETQSMLQFAMLQQGRWDHIIQCHQDPLKCTRPTAPGATARDAKTGALGAEHEAEPEAEAEAKAAPEPEPEASPGEPFSAPEDEFPRDQSDASSIRHAGFHVRGPQYLEVIYVPRAAPDYFVAAAGYRFDPIVLRGLFVTGQKEAIRQTDDGLLDRLGWNGEGDEHAAELLRLVKDDETALENWLAQVECSWNRLKEARRQEGRKRFQQRVPSCPEAPTAAYPPVLEGDPATTPPPYFGGDSDACRCFGSER